MRVNNITTNYPITKRTTLAQHNTRNVAPQNQTSPSFKGGVPAPVANGLSKFYGKVAAAKPFTKFIEWFSKSNRTFTHILAAESCLLSGFYMLTTLTNDKIKKEQKPQMIINDALTLGVSTAGAYLVEDKISNVIGKFAEKYFTKHAGFYTELGEDAALASIKGVTDRVEDVLKGGADKLDEGIEYIVETVGDHLKGIKGKATEKAFHITDEEFGTVTKAVREAIEKNKDKIDIEATKKAVEGKIEGFYKKAAARAEADSAMIGINKLKVLVVFGIIYRYISPVIMTPIANKLSDKFFNKNKQTQKA